MMAIFFEEALEAIKLCGLVCSIAHTLSYREGAGRNQNIEPLITFSDVNLSECNYSVEPKELDT